MPARGVPIEQLRPDPTLCTKKFEERERVLRHHLTLLREDVGYCSRATDAILLCHAQFAYLMAQRIDDASRSWLKGSEHIAHMQGNLKSFVSVLEKMEVQKKSSTARQILGWLNLSLIAPAASKRFGKQPPPFVDRHPKYARVKNWRASSLLLFLKDIVPKEAHIAQKSLPRSAHEDRSKGTVALRGPNPDLTAVAQEWRKVAKQYQSMLPDDDDPDG
ncbi:hypothetical protein EDB86DRAFT_2834649 [Lactarius hatsudake]|nr:hypothetical protein EDB86DRAFT_2834649 [Lactarius hatsudake]